jgi:hypothetical protein
LGNHWFKHYNTAHEGQTISELWAENDHEAIAFYWTVLEMVSRWESEDRRGFWAANISIFRSKLGMKSQRSTKLLSKIAQRFQLNLEWISDQSFQLLIPNWLELQENRGGKTQAKTEQKPYRRKKIEDRSKKKDISKGEVFENIFGNGPPALVDPIPISPVGGSAKADQPEMVSKFIGAYVSSFQNRYGARPDLSGKRLGQIKSLVKGAENFDELCQLVQAYCQSDDDWFRKKMHDVQTFAENIGKVRVMMANGVDVDEIAEAHRKKQADKEMKKFFEKIQLEEQESLGEM